MNTSLFYSGLTELEVRFTQDYTKQERGRLQKEVYEKRHPTNREWEETVRRLKTSSVRLPTIDDIKWTLKETQQELGKDSLRRVECETCGGHGVLYLRRDHPVIVKALERKGTSWFLNRLLGCTCPNKPARMGSIAFLLHEHKELFQRSDFERLDGMRVDESDEEYNERKFQENVALMDENPDAVPKSLQEYYLGRGPAPWEGEGGHEEAVSKVSKSMELPF